MSPANDMDKLADDVGSLKLNSLPEYPFHPTGYLAQRLDNVPRYLFRVFSPKSSGENSGIRMKSVDAQNSCFKDVFSRDPEKVALALNEHLRWAPEKSDGDPFISWTTSLVFAIQYILYKHEKEDLGKISLSVIDTTMFPRGTFIRDLDLIREFQARVPENYAIRVWHKGTPRDTTWGIRGLANFGNLRRKQHKDHRGFYYFGEYLSQGETHINGRSYTISSNRLIRDNLFVLDSRLRPRSKDKPEYGDRPRWANAVISFREPLYHADQRAVELTSQMVLAAKAIAMEFTPQFCVPVWANLMALRPFRTDDARIGQMIYARFPEQVERICTQRISVVADHTIPEVQKFQKIISAVREAHYSNTITKRTQGFVAGINDITRLLNEEMLVTSSQGPAAAKSERINTVYLEPLLDRIQGFRKELGDLSARLGDDSEPGSLA